VELKTHKRDKEKLLNEVVDLKIQLKTTTEAITRMEVSLKQINSEDKENRKRLHTEIDYNDLAKSTKSQKQTVHDISKTLQALVRDSKKCINTENMDYEQKIKDHIEVLRQIITKLNERGSPEFKKPKVIITESTSEEEGRVLKRVKISEEA
jgi:translation initiation factor 2B subunit (eIF-2B alpha/beta/delta family)